MGFTPYCVHRKPAAARRGRVCSRTLGVTATPMLVVKHQVKDEDGVPCYVYKMPNRMLGKVGSGSSGDRFLQKGAEWANVKSKP